LSLIPGSGVRVAIYESEIFVTGGSAKQNISVNWKLLVAAAPGGPWYKSKAENVNK